MAERSVAERLEALRREVRRTAPPPAPSPVARPAPTWSARRVALAVAGGASLLVLPFVLYVRGSVALYLDAGRSPWVSVAGAAALTALVLVAYSIWLTRRLRAAGARTFVRRVALSAAVGWCAYAALYLARDNAKSDDVRRHYRSLNPVLRVALATAVLADRDMVVTDARRVAADYARMGLPVNDRTRHYVQPNGWVHAVDLRTIGHGELRNRLLAGWFRLMGFQTLRHVGTADHLHVQLPVRSR